MYLALTHLINLPKKRWSGFCFPQDIRGTKMSLPGPSTGDQGIPSLVCQCHPRPIVSHHPGMLNLVKPETKPQWYWLCPDFVATVFACLANSLLPSSSCQPPSLAVTVPSLHACCPFWADPCHHITVLSLFPSTGATIHARNPTLCCCIWFPSRDSNYFLGNIMNHISQFSYFIIVAVTLWPLYSEPAILQNG